MIAARALCEVCCRRTRLRRDGRLMAHAATVYDGHLGPLMANLGDVRCAGSGMTPGEIGSDVLQNCVWCGGKRTPKDIRFHDDHGTCMRMTRKR